MMRVKMTGNRKRTITEDRRTVTFTTFRVHYPFGKKSKPRLSFQKETKVMKRGGR